jgi:hypothetical protein
VSEDDDRLAARRPVLVGREEAPALGRDAHHVEEVARGDHPEDALGLLAGVQAVGVDGVAEHPLEHFRRPLAIVLIVGIGERVKTAPVGADRVETHEAARLRHRQRTQQQRVRHAEDGRVRADA